MEFPERLKQLRKENGLTQNKLAEICNVKQATVKGWEKGYHQTSFETLIFLADYFDVSTDFLLGRKNEY